MTQNNLGAAYQNLPTGDRGANLDKAIACYLAALRIYTEADFPQDWAMTYANVGFVWWRIAVDWQVDWTVRGWAPATAWQEALRYLCAIPVPRKFTLSSCSRP